MSNELEPSAPGESRKRDNSENLTNEQPKKERLSDDSTYTYEMSGAVRHRKKWKRKAKMATYNLAYCMVVLDVLFGYMIGSATAKEMSDARLINRLEVFDIV